MTHPIEFQARLIESGVSGRLMKKALKLARLAEAGIPANRIAAHAKVGGDLVETYLDGHWKPLSKKTIRRIETALATMAAPGYEKQAGRYGRGSVGGEVIEKNLRDSGIPERRIAAILPRMVAANERGKYPSNVIAARAGIPLPDVSNYRSGRWRRVSIEKRRLIEAEFGRLGAEGFTSPEARAAARQARAKRTYMEFHRRGRAHAAGH